MRSNPALWLSIVLAGAVAACGPSDDAAGPSLASVVGIESESGDADDDSDHDGFPCELAGPQSARDITKTAGTNPITFDVAPPYSELGICDVHFHRFAEHSAPGYDMPGEGGQGFICTSAQAASPSGGGERESGCTGLEVGDTIEVHWVFSNCGEPGPSLDTCAAFCDNPQVRAEEKAYVLVGEGGVDFNTLGPDNLPSPDGAVEYLGSTTGDKYDNEACSRLQVTWNVRPACDQLNIHSLDKWCSDNVYRETKPQGVRPLVEDLALLASIGE